MSNFKFFTIRSQIFCSAGSMLGKITLTSVILMCCLSGRGQYPISVLTGTYTNLVGATALTPNSSLDYYHALNYIFPTFNRNGDFNLLPNVPSLGAYITSEGYLAVYETPGYQNTIVYHCFYNNNLNTYTGITKVSAKLEGIAPNRIAKFEWQNLVYSNDTNQRVNFQAWLHEKDSAITYHFGPNTLTNQAIAGSTGLIVINPTFTALLDQINLEGSPTTPVTYTGITTFALPTLDTNPNNGKIIRFGKNPQPPVSPVGIVTNKSSTDFAIYPNPFKDKLVIRSLHKKAEMCLYNCVGSLVKIIQVEGNTEIVDLENLPAGLYSFRWVTDGSVNSGRLIKE